MLIYFALHSNNNDTKRRLTITYCGRSKSVMRIDLRNPVFIKGFLTRFYSMSGAFSGALHLFMSQALSL